MRTIMVAASLQNARAENGAGIVIRPAAGTITVDGAPTEDAWRDAARIDTWYETRPADNQPARVHSVALLAYDERCLYVALELDDADPGAIRAPLGDRANVPIWSDAVGEGRVFQEFTVNLRWVQYDGIVERGFLVRQCPQ